MFVILQTDGLFPVVEKLLNSPLHSFILFLLSARHLNFDDGKHDLELVVAVHVGLQKLVFYTFTLDIALELLFFLAVRQDFEGILLTPSLLH